MLPAVFKLELSLKELIFLFGNGKNIGVEGSSPTADCKPESKNSQIWIPLVGRIG